MLYFSGIILVDPHITEGYPLWNGYGNLGSPPSMKNWDPTSSRRPDVPIFNDLISKIFKL